MDPARGLRRLNRLVLSAYSRRTIQTLRAALPFRLAIPRLEQFLAHNLGKEIEKDTLVIAQAAAAHAAGTALDRAVYARVLASARAVDQRFLAQAAAFPVSIHVAYEEIEPLRMQRMQRLAAATMAFLDSSVAGRGLRRSLRSAWTREALEKGLREILVLYAQEAMVLSRSVRLPGPLALVREKVAQRLLRIMEEAAGTVAGDAARLVHRSPERNS